MPSSCLYMWSLGKCLFVEFIHFVLHALLRFLWLLSFLHDDKYLGFNVFIIMYGGLEVLVYSV